MEESLEQRTHEHLAQIELFDKYVTSTKVERFERSEKALYLGITPT